MISFRYLGSVSRDTCPSIIRSHTLSLQKQKFEENLLLWLVLEIIIIMMPFLIVGHLLHNSHEFENCLTDSIDVLLDVYGSNRDAQSLCLLTLRNLCFYAPSKTLLASNGNGEEF